MCVSVTWHEGGQCRLHQYDPVPLNQYQHLCFSPRLIPAVVCVHVCVFVCDPLPPVTMYEQYMAAHTVAVKNHNSVPSSSTVLLVVRGDCVLPRLLVGERSLHWSLTGFHSDDGGSSPQPLILNGTDLPLAELIVCHEDRGCIRIPLLY